VAGVAWSFVACRFCPKRVHLASMLPWFWAITLGILSAKMIFVLSSFVHLHNYMAWRDPCWIPARASHRDERLWETSLLQICLASYRGSVLSKMVV
jgi:hypothetical protein